MSYRTRILMSLAVVCGLALSIFTAQLLRQRILTVLVAKKPLPRGTLLRDPAALFDIKEYPAGTPLPAECVTSFEQLGEQARDHILKQGLNAGEPLTLTNVIDKRQGGLAWGVQPGYTGLAVRATPESSFFGLLEPDNYVKVIFLKKTIAGDKKSIILMKNIRVLAIDTNLDTASAKGKSVPTIITLEVTDDEAKRLRLAMDDGPLTLGLMSQGDLQDRKGDAEPIEKQSVLVAQGPIARGTTLKDARVLFALRQVPIDQLPDHCVIDFEQLADQANTIVVKPLKAGEPLSSDYLMARETRQGFDRTLTIIEGPNRKIYAHKPNGMVELLDQAFKQQDKARR